ncbi:MAG: hypothetical protein Q9173_001689 [Seirophora scorigena]
MAVDGCGGGEGQGQENANDQEEAAVGSFTPNGVKAYHLASVKDEGGTNGGQDGQDHAGESSAPPPPIRTKPPPLNLLDWIDKWAEYIAETIRGKEQPDADRIAAFLHVLAEDDRAEEDKQGKSATPWSFTPHDVRDYCLANMKELEERVQKASSSDEIMETLLVTLVGFFVEHGRVMGWTGAVDLGAAPVEERVDFFLQLVQRNREEEEEDKGGKNGAPGPFTPEHVREHPFQPQGNGGPQPPSISTSQKQLLFDWFLKHESVTGYLLELQEVRGLPDETLSDLLFKFALAQQRQEVKNDLHWTFTPEDIKKHFLASLKDDDLDGEQQQRQPTDEKAKTTRGDDDEEMDIDNQSQLVSEEDLDESGIFSAPPPLLRRARRIRVGDAEEEELLKKKKNKKEKKEGWASKVIGQIWE